MKREYIKPEVACIDINTELIMQPSSVDMGDHADGDFEELSRGHHGQSATSNESVWDKEW